MTLAQERYDAYLAEKLSPKIDELCAAVEVRARQVNLAAGGASAQTGGALKQFQTVGPHAREKLKSILQHYAKQAHPWKACFRDRVADGLAPESARRECSVIVDLIFGTTEWRNKNFHGAPQPQYLAEGHDDEATQLLLAIDELPDLYERLDLGRYEDDPSIDEVYLSVLTARARDKLPDSAFALPGRKYPYQDLNHARAALSRVSQHGTPEEQAVVRRKVYAKFPQLRQGNQ